MILRKIETADCLPIHKAFKEQGWDKPIAQYQNYVALQNSGQRDIIIAEWQQQFAGYLTINWQPGYPLFKEKGIPEVADFNVLKKYQRLGIGTALMDEAEKRIQKISDYVGIGFGVYKDYGAAQILYIKRGYIPDGNGLSRLDKTLKYGESVVINDDLAFYLTKYLKH